MTCHSERQSKNRISSLLDTLVREFAPQDYERRAERADVSALSLQTFIQSLTYPVFGLQPSHWYPLPGSPKWLSNRDAHQQA